MVALHQHQPLQSHESEIRVHIGVLPAMTGVSRFLELDPSWHYNKVLLHPHSRICLRCSASCLQHATWCASSLCTLLSGDQDQESAGCEGWPHKDEAHNSMCAE